MSERDYYPAGAYDDPNAPYNEVEVPEKDFEIDVEFVMRTSVTVTTNNSVPSYPDEEGYVEPADTSDTNWEDAYDNSGHYTIPELLDELKGFIENEIPRVAANSGRGRALQRMLESCQNWECYDKTFELSE